MIMRTTIDIPEELIAEAMKVTNITTKTDVIKEGLINLIRREKAKNIKKFKGAVNLDIDMDIIRKR
jgi:Arc/MetJ family transcription regulator